MFILGLLVLAFVLALRDAADAQEIARRIRDGDRAAFRTFFDRHHGRLLGAVQGRGVSRDDAEDVVQNAFLYIWEHRERIDPAQSLRAYLFRIGYTRALNAKRGREREVAEADPEDAGRAAATPETDAEQAELRAHIQAAVDALPERRRQVFELCFVQGFTYREAAEALDVTRKTVENHMGLALKDLRGALGDAPLSH